MSEHLPKVGDTAEYIFDEIHGELADTMVIGDVVKVGKTYADVAWRGGRVERIRFREPHRVTFKPAT